MSDERLPLPAVDHLTDEQRSAYDEIVHGRRARGPHAFRIVVDDGKLLGPFGPMVLHPPIGRPLQALGAALRYDGCLPSRVREIVICIVAVAHDSEFEWYTHAAVARAVGVSETVLDALRNGDLPAELTDQEQTARRLARASLAGQRITDELFASASSELGIEGVIEIVALVGYYRMLADMMKAFDLDRHP